MRDSTFRHACVPRIFLRQDGAGFARRVSKSLRRGKRESRNRLKPEEARTLNPFGVLAVSGFSLLTAMSLL
jgi:hypothetical protein